MKSGDRELGDILGERRIVFRDAPRRWFTVALGKPRKSEGDRDWHCPFRFKGASLNRLEYAHGVDALQALTMALEGIRSGLDRIGKPLAWSGVLPDHTGFHRLMPISAGGPVVAGIEEFVDREMRRRLREVERKYKRTHREKMMRAAKTKAVKGRSKRRSSAPEE
jgi:hypothetical protein